MTQKHRRVTVGQPAKIPSPPSYRELNQVVKDIESLIGKYDPLDLIANLAFENLAFSTAGDTPDHGLQACVEYLAVLCLKKGQPLGTDRSIPPAVIADLQQRMLRLFGSVALQRGLSSCTATPLDQARRYAEQMFLSVRNLDDFDDLEAMLGGLFSEQLGPIPSLDTHLGFRSSSAATLARHIGELLNGKLAARKSKAQKLLRTLRKEISGEKKMSAGLQQFLRRARSKKQKEELLIAYVAKQTFSSMADVYSFAPADLVGKLAMDEVEVCRLLDVFSLTFGDVRQNFTLPEPFHNFLLRPIIKSGRGYFCPVPDLLLWSIRPRLEELLKPNDTIWQPYQKHRARYLEDRGATLFQEILPSATVLKDLKYRSDEFSENHKNEGYDLDLAVLFNGIAFLVECKGGTLPQKARSGKSRPTRDAIEDLVIEPFIQADRARRYIESGPSATFELPSGLSIAIDRTSIDRFFLVALTLEDVNLFTADPRNMVLLQSDDGHLPWIVNLLTLEMISRFIQVPAEFIHYLSRRLRLTTQKKIRAVEELDYFGCYLDCGLYFDDHKIKEFTDVALDGFTEPIEAYRRFETGRSTLVVEKPRQNFPSTLAALLYDLQQHTSRSALQVSLLLLEMNGDARERVAEAVSNLHGESQTDRKLHDFSILRKDGVSGFTFMVAKELTLQELLWRLSNWCETKMATTGAKQWGGIASLARSGSIADGCVALKR